MLAGATGHFRGAHRHPGPIHPQVQGGSEGEHLFHLLAFVDRDLGPQRLRDSFHLFGADFDACQLVQQPATLLKAHQGGRARGHAQHAGGQRRPFQTQGLIARADL